MLKKALSTITTGLQRVKFFLCGIYWQVDKPVVGSNQILV
jgi:hypothetical protein